MGMKLKFKPSETAPDKYIIDNEIVNDIDLSIIEYGGEFIGSDETDSVGIVDAYRDENNDLFVTLSQQVSGSKWEESDWINAEDYDTNKVYVKFIKVPMFVIRTAKTERGVITYD